MSIKIDRASIQKLGHETQEIRLRTLEQIENKLGRALRHDERIDFRPGELIKYLIRWFAFQPLQAKDIVLNLIMSILKSRYRQEALDYLGEDRLKKELGKVKILVKSSPEVQLVRDILNNLETNNAEDVIEISDTETYLPSSRASTQSEDQADSMGYEAAWSKASAADYNSLKIIGDVLKTDKSPQDLHNALQHLQITIDDYPAEYFLQPPHVFLTLLELFESEECTFEDLSDTLICFSKSLLGRLKTRKKAVAFCSSRADEVPARCQVSVSVMCTKILELCMRYLQCNLFTMNNGVFNVFRLIMEVFRIIEVLPKRESPSIEYIFEDLHNIAKSLRKSFEQDEFPIIARVKYLLILFTLRKILDNEKYNGLTPGSELKVALLDLPLMKLLPEQYAQIVKICGEEMDEDMRTLITSDTILKYPVEILKNPKASDEHILRSSPAILDSFAIHDSLELIERVFSSILGCIPLFAGNKELRQIADQTLIKMFSHHSMTVKLMVYKESAIAIKKYFMCLLDGENAFPGVNNIKLIDDMILGLPLTSELLAEIACCGFDDPTLHQSAEDILYMPIKCRLMMQEHWPKVLEIILPNIPLYQCLVKSDKLSKGLLELLDPDLALFPKLDILQGNLRFLFHPDAHIRSEALIRVIYILTSQPDASRLLPDVMEVSDVIPNDCCLLQVPRDIDRIFCGGFYESSMVDNLMQLLLSADIEPLIRKTVLMQLNVVGQDQVMNQAIFDAGGWMVCLQSLECALQKQSHSEYPDSVLPIVGILSKLLFCDPQFRQELSKEENVLILLVRCLFLYVNDIALKQDVALCLFLLLYSSFVVGKNHITVPKILLNLRLPVKCQPQLEVPTRHSPLEMIYLAEMPSSLNDPKISQRYIRMIIAYLWCDKNLVAAQVNKECTPSLTKSDLRIIKSTSMSNNIAKYLNAISNATEQTKFVHSISSIRLMQLLSGDILNTESVIKAFRRFMQNPNQLVLLENVVELLSTLVQVNNEAIIAWLRSDLREDQSPLLQLLKNGTDTPLSMYKKLCGLLSEVFQRSPTPDNPDYMELEVFETLLTTTDSLFTKRDLDRTRCTLGVMQVLSARTSLHSLLSKKQIHSICKKLFLFSITLKSFTQTGSDLQKGALLIVSSLSASIEDFKLRGSYIKYLSGLCGHNDYQVRTLAWCILARIAKTEEGAESLISELAYLPGGFRACCLSTLMDITEVAMVRQLAGLLFADLLKGLTHFNEVNDILQKFDFFSTAYRSQKYFFPGDLLLTRDRKEITTCEIIRAYCKICVRLLELKPVFCGELAEKPFINKLYQLVRRPADHVDPAKSFASMVGEICNLYSRFSRNHLSFLQKTLCRDSEFVSYLCTFLTTSQPQQCLMNILNLLMVLSKDQTGFQNICESFAANSQSIINLVIVSLDPSLCGSLLQPTCLALITFLLIKCQQKDSQHECFSNTLETTLLSTSQKKYASQVLFLQMSKLLNHNFPMNTGKYDVSPSASKVLLCEAIAVILKTSEKARQTAKNIRFLEKILLIFKDLLESINVPCTTFVRRYGETKKLAIVKHLTLLYGIILNWFSVDVLIEELQMTELTKVLIHTWPWNSHSTDLRILYLKNLAFMSDKSNLVCRYFSVPIANQSTSILQMLLKLLTAESNKVKTPSSCSTILIKIGLRTVMNCCSCQEGRMALIKLHAFDIFDTIHPFNIKPSKAKNDILAAWLTFWELFSRYPEGATSRYLIGLCTIINKSHDPSIRLIGLKILRNMTFQQSNRASILASADFLYTINTIITNSQCYSERLVVCTALWRLISGGAKYAAAVRNTKIDKKLTLILEDIEVSGFEDASTQCQAKDLANVIEIILRILKSS